MNEGFGLEFGKCGAEEALKAAAAMAMMGIIEKLHEENAREMTGRGKSETEGVKKVDDTESRSPFHATVEGMISADYRERFKAEYQQTKIRYERLKAFNAKIEAAKMTENVETPKHDCPDNLLRAQQSAMGEYLHILEIRAVIEGIDI